MRKARPFFSEAREASRSSRRIFTLSGKQSFFGVLQKGYCLLPRNRGEIIEEFIQRITSFKIIEESLHWDPRAGKAGCSAHDFRV
jgi:hypothetical protein